MQPDRSATPVPAVEQERGAHSYRSFSWRGSWPTMRCVHCGCDSNSPASYQLCPGKPAKKTWGVNPIAEVQATVEPSEEKHLRNEIARLTRERDDASAMLAAAVHAAGGVLLIRERYWRRPWTVERVDTPDGIQLSARPTQPPGPVAPPRPPGVKNDVA